MAGDSEALRGASGDPGKAGGVKLNPVAASSSDMVDWAAYFRTYCELPRRQRQVMDLLLEGSDTKTIARMLGISSSTVRAHTLGLRKQFDVLPLRNCSSWSTALGTKPNNANSTGSLPALSSWLETQLGFGTKSQN